MLKKSQINKYSDILLLMYMEVYPIKGLGKDQLHLGQMEDLLFECA